MITQRVAIAKSRPDGDIRNGDPKRESVSYLIGILQSKENQRRPAKAGPFE